jgi:hypothetical protein
MEEALNEAFSDYEIDPNTLEIKGKSIIKNRESSKIKKADSFHYVKTFDKTFKDLEAILRNTSSSTSSERIKKNHQ